MRVPGQSGANRLWWLVFGLAWVPAGFLAAQALGGFGGLGVNPIEKLVRDSGTYAIYALLIALAVTPLRRLTGLKVLARLRRLLGLTAFAYVSLHWGLWLGVDLFFAWDLLLDDLQHRPFILVGFAAWLILLALAVTSTRRAMSWLQKNWQRLHRLVYVAGVLAVLHVLWLTRADFGPVTVYALILLLLLGLRGLWWVQVRANLARSP